MRPLAIWLVVLLGLCPLLAVTGTAVNGIGLGLATLLVLMISNLSVSLIRGLIRPEIRIPMYVLIISSLVTCIELIFLAWFLRIDRIFDSFKEKQDVGLIQVIEQCL